MVKVIRRNRIKRIDECNQEEIITDESYDKLGSSLDDNENVLREMLKNNQFIVFRRFENTENESIKCCLIFADGMSNKKILNGNVIEPIMSGSFKKVPPGEGFVEYLINKVITTNEIGKTITVEMVVSALMSGDAVLLIDGCSEAIVIHAKAMEVRKIDEPLSETVVRGPREAFTEAIETNISLIRRRRIYLK